MIAEKKPTNTDILKPVRAHRRKAKPQPGHKLASILPKPQLYRLLGLKKELQNGNTHHSNVH